MEIQRRMYQVTTPSYPDANYNTFPRLPSLGYTFQKWQIDGVDAGTAVNLQITMDKSKSVQAFFTRSSWTLTIQTPTGGFCADPANPTVPITGDKPIPAGGALYVQAVANANWHFLKIRPA